MSAWPQSSEGFTRAGECAFKMLYLHVWASLIAQSVKNPRAMQETLVDSWVGEICWRRDRLPTPVHLGFPCGSAGKESTCNAGDLGSTWVGKIPWRKERIPTPVFWPGESMDYTVHGVAKRWTQLSDFHFHPHYRVLFLLFLLIKLVK